VLASKFGAEFSLLVSPLNTKLGWELELELVDELEELDAPDDEALNSIQGTATCFPEPCEELEEEMPLLELLEELLLGEVLLLLGEELLLGEVLLLLGEELLLELLSPERDSTANSNRPDAGFTIASLIVPIWVPELPVTCAPVSWLTRMASCPIRPVALRPRLLKPDWLLEELP
jgi:hypothetical protein